MLFKRQLLMLIGAAVFLTNTAHASDPMPPSPEQMQAVRDCAAKQGVDLPAPPPPPPREEGSKDANGDAPPPPPPSPPPGGDHGPRKLTDEQREVLDACFKENGLQPPAPGRHGAPRPTDDNPQ